MIITILRVIGVISICCFLLFHFENFKQSIENQIPSGLLDGESQALLRSLKKIIGDVASTISDFNNNTMVNIYELIAQYKDYLSTLSNAELDALSHIIISVVVLYCFSTILLILFSDKIIENYKLDSRFPRFAKLFTFRNKVNKYNIIFYTLVIFGMIGLSTFADLIILLRL